MTIGLLQFATPSGNQGFSQTNTFANDASGAMNAIFAASSFTFTGTDTTYLDANGYPTKPLTGGQLISLNIGFVASNTGTGTQWVFKWTPSGDAAIFFNGGWSNITATGCTATSNGFFTNVTCTAGTPARVTFNWSQLPGNLLVEFKAANYAAGNPQIVLCRASDEASIAAGNIFTPEYIALYKALNLRTIRPMEQINSGSLADTMQSQWRYRSTLSTLGWNVSAFPPTVWGGTISGTNQYTVALPTDSSSSGWVNGEVIQGVITNSATTSTISVTGAANNGSGLIRLAVNATAQLTTGQQVFISNVGGVPLANGVQTVTVFDGTHIDLQGTAFAGSYVSGGNVSLETLTVTGKTGGTVMIANNFGYALHTPFTSNLNSAAGSTVTFVYNALLGVVVYKNTGITGNMPIEAMVNLANNLRVNLWTNLPILGDDNYFTSEAALIRDSLSSNLKWYVELSNETWNTSFPQAGFCISCGNQLNISANGFHGLRTRQIMEAITNTWTSTRTQADLVRVMPWQAFGDSTITSHRLNGSELNSGTNALLLAYAGSVNYTTNGQRPIDWCDSGAYAPYFSGVLYPNGFNTVSDAGNIVQIQNLATAFAISPTDTTSQALIDSDIRQGTTKNTVVSSVSGTTINATANGLALKARVVFTNSGGALYTGLSLNTPYFVVTAATNSFSVSATEGGSAISVSGGSGTTTVGQVGSETLLENATVVYQTAASVTNHPGWENVAATYDTYRNGVSQPLLNIECYEGGLEALSQTATQCASMGVALNPVSITSITGNTLNVTTNTFSNGNHVIFTNVGSITGVTLNTDYVVANSTGTSFTLTLNGVAVTLGGTSGVAVVASTTAANVALTAGLNAYKNSAAASALVTSYFQQFKGQDSTQPLTYQKMAHSKTPSWFLTVGTTQWSLLSGGVDSTPFQTYNGVAAFNG